MTNDVKKYIDEILNNVKQMVLSTSKENKPWSATVFFAFDGEKNIYFFSTKNRRHSQEIAANPNVSGVIAREHTEGLEEPSRSVQFEGECKLVTAEEAKAAYELYKKRHPKIVEFHDLEDAPEELYKITIKKIVLFDTLNFKGNPRQELDL